MTRLNTCGFELGLGNGAVPNEFTAITGTAWSEHADAARTGTYGLKCLAATSFGFVQLQGFGQGLDAAGDQYFIRIYVRVHTAPSATTPIIKWVNPADAIDGISVRLTTGRALQIFDNQASPTQVGSDSGALTLDVWYRLEFGAFFTGNVLVAKLDGTDFVNDTTHTWGTGGCISLQQFNVGIGTDSVNVTSGEVHFDDFAWNDQNTTTGPINQNTYPGEGKVLILNPNAAGDSNLGTYVGGAGDATNLAENPPNTTSYIALDIANDTLDVNCTACGLAGTETIAVVQICNIIRGDISGSASYQSRIKSSTFVSNGSTTAFSTTTFTVHSTTANVKFPNLTRYQDPTPTNWTVTLLDALQIGLIAIDATPDVWSTRCWAYVDYRPAAAATTTLPVRPRPPTRVWSRTRYA